MSVLLQIITKVIIPLFLGIRMLRQWRAQVQEKKLATSWVSVPGQITGGRIDDNDTGSVTQYCPVLEVRYIVDGKAWTGTVAAPREISPDRGKVQGLLRGAFGPGQPVALKYMANDPGRVMIA